MELEIFNDEANKIWRQIAGERPADLLKLEIDLYKNLLQFFQVGDYYYFIFNFKTLQFDFVSKEIEDATGYAPSEVSVEFFMDKVHPDDRLWFLELQNKTIVFLEELPQKKRMKYKLRFDYRFQKRDGSYIRVLHQAAVAQMDENGGIMRTLVIHTDITHLKTEKRPVLSFIGMDGEPSYIDVQPMHIYAKGKETLTKREKEILLLLIKGKLSKEIACILNISRQTVDAHRKNMLRKNSVATTGELIGMAIRRGWL